MTSLSAGLVGVRCIGKHRDLAGSPFEMRTLVLDSFMLHYSLRCGEGRLWSNRVGITATMNDVREPLRLYCNLEISAYLLIFPVNRRQGKRAEHTTQAMLGELMPAPTTETSQEPARLPPAQAAVESERRPETSHSESEESMDADEDMDSDDDGGMDGAQASDNDAGGSQDSEGDEPKGEGRV